MTSGNGKAKRRLLIISDRYPGDLTDGKHLRVHNICRELCSVFDCYFVALADDEVGEPKDRPIPFIETAAFRERDRQKVSLLQRLRLSDGRYLSASSPDFYRGAVNLLSALTEKWAIDAAIVFEPRLAEAATELAVPTLLDYPDCTTLMLERRLRNRRDQLSLREALNMRVRKMRASNRERFFLPRFARTVTISAQDRAKFLEVTGLEQLRVQEVPNGVSLDTFRRSADSASERPGRHIAFWGNLAFPPNWTAVNFFYDKVFLPHLADKGITWHIVGADADERIHEISAHPDIVLAGFQEDLVGYLSGMDVMINPMVEGGGLKNKVLEAFAMGLPVVSTTLGAAAIQCDPDSHFLQADAPDAFAKQVLRLLDDPGLAQELAGNAHQLVASRYDWPMIGHRYASVVQEVMAQ